MKSRKRQLWLEWAEPVNLTALLCAGTRPISFRISPAKVLAYANNFLRAASVLFPIGHVEQNRKLGFLSAANEEAAPLSGGHWGAVLW